MSTETICHIIHYCALIAAIYFTAISLINVFLVVTQKGRTLLIKLPMWAAMLYVVQHFIR